MFTWIRYMYQCWFAVMNPQAMLQTYAHWFHIMYAIAPHSHCHEPLWNSTNLCSLIWSHLFVAPCSSLSSIYNLIMYALCNPSFLWLHIHIVIFTLCNIIMPLYTRWYVNFVQFPFVRVSYTYCHVYIVQSPLLVALWTCSILVGAYEHAANVLIFISLYVYRPMLVLCLFSLLCVCSPYVYPSFRPIYISLYPIHELV